MATKHVINRSFVPKFDNEGYFLRPLHLAAPDKYESGVTTFKRLYSHHTLSSVRKYAFYRIPKAPKDSLDFILESAYNHSKEIFPVKEDTLLQWETRGRDTWRRLRNTFDQQPPVVIPLGHPIKHGGIIERRSPHNIKLMNSGIHSAKTAPGYSRQPSGGTVFYY